MRPEPMSRLQGAQLGPAIKLQIRTSPWPAQTNKASSDRISRDDGRILSVIHAGLPSPKTKLGHDRLAEELRDMIGSAKAESARAASPGKLVAISSAAKPRSELANLLAVSSQPTGRDMVLDESAHRPSSAIAIRNSVNWRIKGARAPRQKLLSVRRPPGTGIGTMTATALAGGLRGHSGRLDSLITPKIHGRAATQTQNGLGDALMQNVASTLLMSLIPVARSAVSNIMGEIRH